jgi:hypothetical protein
MRFRGARRGSGSGTVRVLVGMLGVALLVGVLPAAEPSVAAETARPFERVGALTLAGDGYLHSAVIDRAGRFAYFGTDTSPGRIVKVDLATFTRVGTLTLPAGDDRPYPAVIDPAGRFAYFGTITSPGRVVKVDLASFTHVATLTLATGVNRLTSAVIDPAGRFAYFGTDTWQGQVVKVDLDSFTHVATLTLAAGDNHLGSAVMDPAGRFAYFGTSTSPGRVVKIDLAGLTHAGTLTLPDVAGSLSSAVIDPAGRYAYFGAWTGPGRVVKVELAGFTHAGTLTLPTGENSLAAALIEPVGQYAYVGTFTSPGRVVKVRVGPEPVLATRLLTTYATTTGWDAHLAADMTGNGRADLVSYHPSNGSWWITSSKPDGTFHAPRRLTTYNTRTGWAAHLAADMTGNGRADLVSYHPSNGSWWITSSRPDGTFHAPRRLTTYNTRTGWEAHLAADVTGNGRAELVSYHPSNGSWWLTASRTDGSFEAPKLAATYPTRDGWEAHLAADVSGNGRAELLSFHPQQSPWFVSSPRADGTFGAQEVFTIYATTGGWAAHVAADVTGNGRADLLSYHAARGRWWATMTVPG